MDKFVGCLSCKHEGPGFYLQHLLLKQNKAKQNQYIRGKAGETDRRTTSLVELVSCRISERPCTSE